jgi:hypothetical protein
MMKMKEPPIGRRALALDAILWIGAINLIWASVTNPQVSVTLCFSLLIVVGVILSGLRNIHFWRTHRTEIRRHLQMVAKLKSLHNAGAVSDPGDDKTRYSLVKRLQGYVLIVDPPVDLDMMLASPDQSAGYFTTTYAISNHLLEIDINFQSYVARLEDDEIVATLLPHQQDTRSMRRLSAKGGYRAEPNEVAQLQALIDRLQPVHPPS